MGPKKNPKREERRIRAAHHKRSSENGQFCTLRDQLEAIGLTLRKIEGDGNCLFRALSDQIYGTSSKHFPLRKQVVHYMKEHREDFEPFIVDDYTFDEHLNLLSQDGTFAGNDSIVAFARLYNCTIVIHQLNEPLWKVSNDGFENSTEFNPNPNLELHISYENGDHYNSIRKLGESVYDCKPANISISTYQKSLRDSRNCYNNHEERYEPKDDSVLAEYDELSSRWGLTEQLMEETGIEDDALIEQVLEDSNLHYETALRVLTNLSYSDEIQSRRSSIWQPGGTGNRIFGDEASRECMDYHEAKRIQKLEDVRNKLHATKHLSNKQRQKLKRAERKLASEHRKKYGDDDYDSPNNPPQNSIIIPNLESLSI